MNNKIALYDKFSNPAEAIKVVATALEPMCKRENEAKLLALVCLSEGLTPTELHRKYDLMPGGRLRKKALAALAEFRELGGKHTWIKTGDERGAESLGDNREAELKLELDGNAINTRYSIADAKRAGVSFSSSSAWSTYPGTLLRAHCISLGVSMLAPEIYAGSDDDDEQTVAPAQPLNLEKVVDIKVEPSSTVVSPSCVDAAANVDEAIVAPPVTATVELILPPEESRPVLPDNLLKKLNEAIPVGEFDLVKKWLVNIKFLQSESDSIAHLSKQNAEKILAKFDNFMRAAREFNAKKD